MQKVGAGISQGKKALDLFEEPAFMGNRIFETPRDLGIQWENIGPIGPQMGSG